MTATPGVYLFRLLPVLFVAAASIAYVFHVEPDDAYRWRNSLPMLALVLLAMVSLYKGGGRWSGSGWQWPLGTLGFAIPAFGLSLYLHYAFSVDLDGIVSESLYPEQLFRYLPLYTAGAGVIGFAIGWIAGRNI